MKYKIEKFLNKYREFLYILHRKPLYGVMPAGAHCSVEDPTVDVTHGDIVHPCIRFIRNGFEGHKWWMVYTPYYGKNEKIENPRLCYADTNEGELPTSWHFYCHIKETPDQGYNSDPTILFSDNKLFVFWRENNTTRTDKMGLTRATYGCSVKNKKVTYFDKPTLVETAVQMDHEICPTVIESLKEYKAYAIHVQFNPKWIFLFPETILRWIYKYKIIELLYLIFGSSRMKTFGVALWKGQTIDETFQYVKTIPFKDVNRLYRPWHLDFFYNEEYPDNGRHLYSVIQSDEKFADICLAHYENNCFRIYRKPLITGKSIGMLGLYKPCGQIVHDTFYLFYTARDNTDSKLNKMFVTSIPWKELLKIMEE